MKKLVVISGLIEAQFSGNQSFKNTLLGLDRNFKVTLITMIPEDRKEYDYSWYGRTEIVQKRPGALAFYNLFKGSHKKIALFRKKNKTAMREDVIETSAVSDFNTVSAFLMDVANIFIAFSLLVKLILHRYKSGRFEYLYCYEVPACIAGRLYYYFDKKVKILRRHQGTALTQRMLDSGRMKSHVLSFGNIPNNNFFVMANDGTFGDKIIMQLNPNAKVFFEPNGVPEYLQNYKTQRERNLNPFNNEVITILSVCKHKKWKRVDRVISFSNQLARQGKLVRLEIIGEGPMTREWKQLAKDAQMQNRLLSIKFLGAKSHIDVLEHMNKADLFVSFYDVSNLGNPLLEAHFLGIPIVTFNSEPLRAIFGQSLHYFPDFETCTSADLRMFLSDSKCNSISRDVIRLWHDRMDIENKWITTI